MTAAPLEAVEPHQRQRFCDAARDLRFRRARESQTEGDVFARHRDAETAGPLETPYYRALVRRHRCNVAAEQSRHEPSARSKETGHDAKQRGLAATGRSEKGNEFAVTDRKIDIAQGQHARHSDGVTSTTRSASSFIVRPPIARSGAADS